MCRQASAPAGVNARHVTAIKKLLCCMCDTLSLLPPPSSSPSLSHRLPLLSNPTAFPPLHFGISSVFASSLPTPRQRPRKKDEFFPAASNLTPWRRCRCSCSPLPPPPSPPELSHSSLSLSIGRTSPSAARDGSFRRDVRAPLLPGGAPGSVPRRTRRGCRRAVAGSARTSAAGGS